MTAASETLDPDLQTVSRTLAERGADYLSVEDFGCIGDGMTDDRIALQKALDWSAEVGRAVHASRSYLLGATLIAQANTTLIASPTARFIRGFGGETNDHGEDAAPLVITQGDDQPHIRIEGGIWGVEVGAWVATMTFAVGQPGAPATVAFPGAREQFFVGPNYNTPKPGVLQQLWVYRKDANGDYDPDVPNNNRIFEVIGWADFDTLEVAGPVEPATVTGMTGSYVPLAGNGFKIRSTGGVIDGVGLINPRGIQFQLEGDGFLLTRSWSRNPTPDGGGGVRFQAGRGMRGTLLDLETSDDCYQFNPSDRRTGETTGATVTRSSFVDCIGRTNQGALVAFISGGGDTYTTGGQAYIAGDDSLTTLTDCYASNIRGRTGGSVEHGGTGIKVFCANSSIPIENCCVENVSFRQSEATPPDKLRAGVLIVTGRQDGGVLNSGVRNLTIENRSGPLVAIVPADDLPLGYSFSKAVDFTVEQARAPGEGSWPGLPLIAAPYADRLVLRDISGDLSGNAGEPRGRALGIGVDFTYSIASVGIIVPAGTVKELVIDGVSTGNAALPTTDGGLWRFGNVGKASVRRLSTTLAGTAQVGGLELTQPSGGPGPTWCRFAEIDFNNILAGKEIVSWQTKAGNQIVDSLRFDDRTETIALLTVGVTTIAPARFAPTIALSLGSGVSSASITAMTPPGVPAPRCTLLVPSGVSIANGTGAGGFVLSSTPLTGGATVSLTVQWLTAGNKWREVARTA